MLIMTLYHSEGRHLKKDLLIGVDGGGTKSTIRLENDAGEVLGEAVSGPANISTSVDGAWYSIMNGVSRLLDDLKIPTADYYLHAGMGLAGTELVQAYDHFINASHSFDTLIVKSDAHIACLAAHGGEDGAIIIVGTGVVGYQMINQQIIRVGGWGFPQDDEGGGAWLGLEAIKVVLRWLDHREQASSLASAIYNYFDRDTDQIIYWSRYATPTIYARLAPIVIQQSQLGDIAALTLVKRAAQAIDHLGLTLIKQSIPIQQNKIPLSFIGSIAPFLQPYFSDELKAHIRPCQYSSAKGAIFMIQNLIKTSSQL